MIRSEKKSYPPQKKTSDCLFFFSFLLKNKIKQIFDPKLGARIYQISVHLSRNSDLRSQISDINSQISDHRSHKWPKRPDPESNITISKILKVLHLRKRTWFSNHEILSHQIFLKINRKKNAMKSYNIRHSQSSCAPHRAKNYFIVIILSDKFI